MAKDETHPVRILVDDGPLLGEACGLIVGEVDVEFIHAERITPSKRF